MSARPSFLVSTLDYDLPPELIAQTPPPHREDARLMIVDRATGRIDDRRIPDFADQFHAGDLLIVNDTKVLPAKFTFHRATGGRIEGLFLEESAPGEWLVMLDGARRLRLQECITCPARSGGTVSLTLLQRLDEGRCRVRIDPPHPAQAILDDIGMTPLPPYICRDNQSVERKRHDEGEATGQQGNEATEHESTGVSPSVEWKRHDNQSVERKRHDSEDQSDRERYQTVYARKPGAVAAPTAGLHLTPDLLARLKERGVDHAAVTLHVGLGTFKPIAVEDLAGHPMHAERYELPAATAQAIERCKTRGNRIIAVGTTSVRVLETAAATLNSVDVAAFRRFGVSALSSPCVPSSRATYTSLPFAPILPSAGATNLLLYPPCEFRVVDALLTNFHLPRSTLLALVMAFAGIDVTRRAYAHAIAQRYRFYSFGDAMLIV